jgi:hypothetical protein
MTRYFIDTEFIEGFHNPLLGKRRHFIDLISIGIVDEEGRTYYAISKEFDLEYVWNNKDTWVKDNVLEPIHKELCRKCGMYGKTYHWQLFEPFTIKSMRNLLRWFGKTNKQIAEDIKMFCIDPKPEFYGYFADYDWVVFCSLFGRMIDLPKGFPMYCRDLKQMLDAKADKYGTYTIADGLSMTLDALKDNIIYPKQENEHNALADAKWNKKLFNLINHLQQPK